MAAGTELWGTFAVDDHVRRRPFVAEVILFDRLVIPTPPGWTADALKEWPTSWQPQRLRELMGVLGDHAIPMTWDQPRRERWQEAYSEYKKQRGKDRRTNAIEVSRDVKFIRESLSDARFLTRSVIRSIIEEADNELIERVRRLPLLPATSIETAVAYRSYHTFREEMVETHSPDGAGKLTDGDALLLSWDFFVPEDPDLSDIELLSRVVRKLETDSEFSEHRRAFNDLRWQLSANGMDALAARAEIERRLAAYNQILRSISRLQTAKTVLTYAAIAAPLVDFLVPGVGTGTGVTLGLASQTWSKWAPDPLPGPEESAVAVVHDLREEFNLYR